MYFKKVSKKLKIQAPKNCWIDEFNCLRSKAYSLICNEQSTQKLKLFQKHKLKITKWKNFIIVYFEVRIKKM